MAILRTNTAPIARRTTTRTLLVASTTHPCFPPTRTIANRSPTPRCSTRASHARSPRLSLPFVASTRQSSPPCRTPTRTRLTAPHRRCACPRQRATWHRAPPPRSPPRSLCIWLMVFQSSSTLPQPLNSIRQRSERLPNRSSQWRTITRRSNSSLPTLPTLPPQAQHNPHVRTASRDARVA